MYDLFNILIENIFWLLNSFLKIIKIVGGGFGQLGWNKKNNHCGRYSVAKK
jgi:hypothetical protein